MRRIPFVASAVLGLTLLGTPSLATLAVAQPSAPGPADRLIVVARSDADYDTLRSTVQRAGGSIVKDIRDGSMLVVRGSSAVRAQIQASGLASDIARDHIEQLTPTASARRDLNNFMGRRSRTTVGPDASRAAAAAMGRRTTGDPAVSYPGLMWNLLRIDAPDAWQVTQGVPRVRVGVADTGLDFTHSDLAPRIENVVDFTVDEDPPICATFFGGISDKDLANESGGPELTDWNGHGSWIGGNIAAALDGQGVNGIAPKVNLVSLKISQWCGSAYDSTILDAFTYAYKHDIDVVSISFGGYLDLDDPDQRAIWRQYNRVVQKARDRGTIIAAAAGNEAARLGDAGRVISHGTLTTPGDPAPIGDMFGNFEVPAGVPGVLAVSATGNVVVPASASCTPGTLGTATDPNSATCKPRSDAHQAAGQGKQNQLAYYSNYGPRIDVAAPGGARKFNLPFWDRGGTPGFPVTTSDLTTAFEAFSTTSNWAVEIPCYLFTGGGFPSDQCYSTIQGTSMATPHVSAVLALIASSDDGARGNPDRLERTLKRSVREIRGNETRAISATDKSPGDLSGLGCTTGYCHLGGETIRDSEAYGAGLVDARDAVR